MPSVGVNVFAVTALPLAVYSVTDAKLSVSVGTNVTEVTGLATVLNNLLRQTQIRELT